MDRAGIAAGDARHRRWRQRRLLHLGSAAAFRRLRKEGEIIAIEMQDAHMAALQEGLHLHQGFGVSIRLVLACAGREAGAGRVTLDSLAVAGEHRSTLLKIDVEGAEIDVLESARSWMDRSNLFLIEVHEEAFVARLVSLFAAHGHPLARIEQSPLPFLGRETRSTQNCWLVSDLRQ
jgi:hypothetical protein